MPLPSHGFRRFLTAVAPLAFLLPSLAAPTLDECDRMVRDDPDNNDAYECYQYAARADGSFGEAIRRLEARVQIDPERNYAWSVLGTLERMRGNPKAEEHFRHAIALAEKHDDLRGLMRSSASLGTWLRRQGRLDEAGDALQQALVAARRLDHPRFIAYVRNKQGWLALARNDYGRALRLFREVEKIVFPDGILQQKTSALSGLAVVYRRLGREREAMDCSRRTIALNLEGGDRYGEANSWYGLAAAARSLVYMGKMEPAEFVGIAREAIDAGVAGHNREVELRSRLMLAEFEHGPETGAEFRKILSMLEGREDWQARNWALRILGEWTVLQGPEHHADGFRYLDQAIEAARAHGGGHTLYRSMHHRAKSLFRAGKPREEWIGAFLEVLDTVEGIRGRQPDPQVRSRMFQGFVHTYYYLARRILETLDRSTDREGDLDLAFRVTERVRARLLLDAMDQVGVAAAEASDGEDAAERIRILSDLSMAQKQLIRTDLAELDRQDLLDRVERLEDREEVLRIRRAVADPERLDPAVASVADVQDHLGPEQALLGYYVGVRDPTRIARSEDAVLDWVFLITRDSVDFVPLRVAENLATQVPVYIGRLARRDGSGRSAAGPLGRELLDETLGRLPDGIRRLVIVPVGPLLRLPFGTLPTGDGATLAERFEITYAPSATLWVRWRESGPSRGATGYLAFADPAVGGTGRVSGERSASPWIEGLRLGRLPHARREVAGVRRQLGSGTVLMGEDATESGLKQANLEDTGILHFATHAVFDELLPYRSALILAPGPGGEDGLLQFREVIELDLGDDLVILTGCRSARGEAVRGEGALSLVHAFFRAGARAVIGSLWPLRDDETAELMAELSRGLARGESVSAALAGAQRRMLAAGRPPASWGGLVVLGDGDMVPIPGGRPLRPALVPLGLGCALAALVLLVACLIPPARRRAG